MTSRYMQDQPFNAPLANKLPFLKLGTGELLVCTASLQCRVDGNLSLLKKR